MILILSRSMIVRHLDIVGVAFLPTEADAPLVIDANTMLAKAIARQSFQPIGRWNPQIIQALSDIELYQLAPRKAVQFGGKVAQELALKQPLGVLVTEGLDHEPIITQDAMVGKPRSRPTRQKEMLQPERRKILLIRRA